MTGTLRLGRIAGVELKANWSVFAIFMLIVVGLGAGQFPNAYPDRPPAAYAAAALVAGVAFFLSLLAHELAHAVVARHNGMKVDGITLWLLGGVTRIRGETPDPGAELRIAGVGPAVSLLLGIGFAAVATVLAVIGVRGLMLGTVVWLAVINAILAVFNFLPAAPLDGGRVLHAFLWRLRRDRYSAAVSAARAGRVLGYLLVAFGVVRFLFFTGFGGLWLALIGLFLIVAAAAEERQARIQQALAGVRARDIMTADPVVVPDEDQSVADLVDDYILGHARTHDPIHSGRALAHPHTVYPVIDATGRPTGVVTVGRLSEVPIGRRHATSMRSVLCPIDEVPQIDADESVADLLPRLSETTADRALVLHNGRLVGVISPSDVARRVELAQAGVTQGGWSAPGWPR